MFNFIDEDTDGRITFFEFCHFIFPDLDVEELHRQGHFDSSASSAGLMAVLAQKSSRSLALAGQGAGRDAASGAHAPLDGNTAAQVAHEESDPANHMLTQRNVKEHMDMRFARLESLIHSLASKLDDTLATIATEQRVLAATVEKMGAGGEVTDHC